MLPEIRSILANAGMTPEQIAGVEEHGGCQITWIPPKNGEGPQLTIHYRAPIDAESVQLELKKATAAG